jgi:hypothetical protein
MISAPVHRYRGLRDSTSCTYLSSLWISPQLGFNPHSGKRNSDTAHDAAFYNRLLLHLLSITIIGCDEHLM